MTQQSFNPANFCFNWTEPTDPDNPHDYGWYTWDRKEAHKQAQKARNERVKALKAHGFTVTKSSLSGQLIKRGGIGSGHPEIDLVVTVYYVNYH